jgi:transposase
MNGYSEGLRQKIVSAVERGMPKTQAARTFDVSLSSVKRYVKKAVHGGSLAPKKSPGSSRKLDEKANKLLEDDLEVRPFVVLQDRCDNIETLTGLCLSRSTMCRAITRIGSTRKKGDARHRARRVQKSSLAGDGGCGCGARDAALRGRVRPATPRWRRSTATRQRASALGFRYREARARTQRCSPG